MIEAPLFSTLREQQLFLSNICCLSHLHFYIQLLFIFSFHAFGVIDDTVVYAFNSSRKVWFLVEDFFIVLTELKILIVAILTV